MSAMAQVFGTRLAYVVVALEGTVKRVVTIHDKKKGLIKKQIEEPAGFMVYFPRGHVLRLRSLVELKQYNLDRRPPLINLQGLNDPNSEIGKLMSAQDDGVRRGAMAGLEQQVIQLATAKTGTNLLTPTETMEALR